MLTLKDLKFIKIERAFVFFCALTTSIYMFGQNTLPIDTNLVNFHAQRLVYSDFHHIKLPSISEMKCFINNADKPQFTSVFLKSKGYDNYCFLKLSLDTAVGFRNAQKNHTWKDTCTYRIYYRSLEYIVAFDIAHNKIYRIQGFYNNDFKEMYSDYMYLNSHVVGFYEQNKGKRKFVKNHEIEGVDILKLWDKSMK